MKKYIVTLEVGNYDAPRTYEIETTMSISNLAKVLNEIKFVLASKNDKIYIVNTSKIVCISEMDQPKKKIEMPNIENLPL